MGGEFLNLRALLRQRQCHISHQCPLPHHHPLPLHEFFFLFFESVEFLLELNDGGHRVMVIVTVDRNNIIQFTKKTQTRTPITRLPH